MTATRRQRKVHNEKLHNLYSSPNIISVRKSRQYYFKCIHKRFINRYIIMVRKTEMKVTTLEAPKNRQ